MIYQNIGFAKQVKAAIVAVVLSEKYAHVIVKRYNVRMDTFVCTNCHVEKPITDFVRNRTRRRGHNERCKQCSAAIAKNRRNADLESAKAKARSYYAKKSQDPDWMKERRGKTNASRTARRHKIIAHYGGQCSCCGETTLEFLHVDHINGGGNAHRSEVGQGKHDGQAVLAWVIRNNFPEGFRVLCANCNMSLGAYGYCPHSKRTTSMPASVNNSRPTEDL